MNTQRGYSLIELSITLVIIGFLSSIASQYLVEKDKVIDGGEQYDQNILRPVHQAIEGFIYSYNRLPCPAGDNLGVENCALSQGFIPHQSLALAQNMTNKAGLVFSYAVYANANADRSLDADLQRLFDRNRPFIATGAPPVGTSMALGASNGLDFCQAIVNAREAVFNGNLLNINNGVNSQHVAYVIVDPGDSDADANGNLLDGRNALVGLTYDAAERVANIDYDDHVTVMYFDALWDKIGCVNSESASGHAHANTDSASSIMLQSMKDYLVQVELARDIAEADVAAATATVLNSVASIASAAAALPIGTAESIVTAGVLAPTVGLAIAAIAAAALTTASAAAALAIAVTNLDAANALITTAQGLVTAITNVNTTVHQNMINSDAAGI